MRQAGSLLRYITAPTSGHVDSNNNLSSGTLNLAFIFRYKNRPYQVKHSYEPKHNRQLQPVTHLPFYTSRGLLRIVHSEGTSPYIFFGL